MFGCIETKKGDCSVEQSPFLCHSINNKSWHRYIFRESGPCPIVISKAFHHAVRNGMLCLNFDEDTKNKKK
jgi:hypothetical protein